MASLRRTSLHERVARSFDLADHSGVVSKPFTPSGIITLTTDFGHKGPFVAMIKGAILTRFPTAKIVDLTHEIVEHWPAEAGFWLERAHPFFPDGSVHLAVVDPSVGTEQRILAVHADEHLFLAPDNGLLANLAERPDARARWLDLKRLSAVLPKHRSATFAGRDIFAPVVAELAAGRLRFEELGPKASDLTPPWVDAPEVEPHQVHGIVVVVDNFGNLITNIDQKLLERFRVPSVMAGGRKIPIRRVYAQAKPGEYLALVNSLGVLEIARYEQSAAEGLSVERGAPVSIVETTRD